MSRIPFHYKILFFGTPEFAIPSLDTLVKSGYKIVGVVTRPDEPAGRKQLLAPPPVKIRAQEYNIPVFQPEKLTSDLWKAKIPPADIFIVAAYGKIIPPEVLQMPKFGALNIHPSLLPRWRGPSPIQSAILHGDTETGVTIMQLDAEMDHGPILSQESLAIPPDATYPTLHDILARRGAELLIRILPEYLAGKIIPLAQDHAKATFSKLLTKEDGRIDWSRPAEEIERMIRAYAPWPGAWTTMTMRSKEMRVRIDDARVISEMREDTVSGTIFSSSAHPLVITTGKKSLGIVRLTPEGKKTMDAASFLHGFPEAYIAS
ncbi:MAG: methionyl-tRNA formyltransferase [Parcubacteria group bacterium Gr01-1014_66]|nr:MAG: methionyl-tRNA formyltransferase [Parcubacteria group bacterium Gr01-1014_66]